MRNLVSKEGQDWNRLLLYALLHTVRFLSQPQFSPFELLYGQEVQDTLDVLKEAWKAEKCSDEGVVLNILAIYERKKEMTEVVSDNLKETQQLQNPWYEQTAREREQVLINCWLNGKGHIV